VAELARIAADARVGGMLAGKAGTVLVHVGDADDGLALLEAVCARHPLPRSQWLPTHVNRHAALLAHGERWAHAGGTVDLTTSTTPGLIADGEVPAAEAMARLLAAGVPLERITLSSDGQASLPQFDPDGRLLALDVAPIASLLDCVRALVREHGLALGDALAAATATPARVWGLPRKGRLAVGADADVLLLDRDDLGLRATIAGGRLYSFALAPAAAPRSRPAGSAACGSVRGPRIAKYTVLHSCAAFDSSASPPFWPKAAGA